MDLSDCLTEERIFSLRSRRKETALGELVRSACRTLPGLDPAKVEKALWERERQVSSWIAPGLAIPHGRLPGLGGFYVAVGRSRRGIDYGSPDSRPVHLLVLILGDEGHPDRHIALLAEVARTLHGEATRQAVLQATSRREAYRIISGTDSPGGSSRRPQAVTRSLLSHALTVAGEVGARAVLLHLDALGGIDLLGSLRSPVPVILITAESEQPPGMGALPHEILHVPFPSLTRGSQVTLSLLLAISRGLIGAHDRVVGLFGRPGGTADSLVVIDVARELPMLLPASTTGLLGDVRPAVLERVLRLATDLAAEGREGRPVGTLFVLGDHDSVRRLSHQLVINPFRGYRDEEKSILDPGLEETVKEFASLDGAFLVRGDGVIEAAGAYLRFGRLAAEVPPGLGARHSAAANITAHTQALSVAVSQSTGRVSLYRSGKLLSTFERPKS